MRELKYKHEDAVMYRDALAACSFRRDKLISDNARLKAVNKGLVEALTRLSNAIESEGEDYAEEIVAAQYQAIAALILAKEQTDGKA